MRKLKACEMSWSTKIFELNDKDIELIVSLLHEECDKDIYYNEQVNLIHGGKLKKLLKETYNHCQDLIMELTK